MSYQLRVENDAGSRLIGELQGERYSDVVAVYPSRSELVAQLSLPALLDGAAEISAVGLSLNLICQQYADHRLRQLISSGTVLRCLFLDPTGRAIKEREQDEGYPEGHLSGLTEMNIQTLEHRVRACLPEDAEDRLLIATYDETIRFNLVLIEQQLCLAQPYLPALRGIDSPTMLVQRRWPTAGLYPVFEQIFARLWESSQPR